MLKHYNQANWVCCAILILDPRHKVETFASTSWGRDLKKKTIEEFKKMYQQYTNSPELQEDEEVVKEASNEIPDEDGNKIDFTSILENRPVHKDPEDELKEYLAMKRAGKDQNILEWWKNHEKSFPTLARMTRDLLSIMATSVAAERLFSLAGLVMTKGRSSLNDESARVILCLHSWFRVSN